MSANASSMAMLSDPYAYDLCSYGFPLSTCEYGSATTIPPLSSAGDVYGDVDMNCSLEPYVDKIYWTIDADAVQVFPNNIRWDRA